MPFQLQTAALRGRLRARETGSDPPREKRRRFSSARRLPAPRDPPGKCGERSAACRQFSPSGWASRGAVRTAEGAAAAPPLYPSSPRLHPLPGGCAVKVPAGGLWGGARAGQGGFRPAGPHLLGLPCGRLCWGWEIRPPVCRFGRAPPRAAPLRALAWPWGGHGGPRSVPPSPLCWAWNRSWTGQGNVTPVAASVKEIRTPWAREPFPRPRSCFLLLPGLLLIFWGSPSQVMPGEVLVSECGASHHLDTT